MQNTGGVGRIIKNKGNVLVIGGGFGEDFLG